MQKFRVGDRVKCISSPNSNLILDKVYIIKSIRRSSRDNIYLLGLSETESGDWYSDRFILVPKYCNQPQSLKEIYDAKTKN